MDNTDYRFPFGREIRPCAPSADSPKSLFVLGAYPSALHVRWSPPDGLPGGAIKAIPVDNEPEPFWSGADAQARIAQWRLDVGFDDSWGKVVLPPDLNGPSGAWVESEVLAEKFGASRTDACITDCLNTYRSSDGAAEAIKERFLPFAKAVGLPEPRIAPHPTESEIVSEALAQSRAAALRAEIVAAAPDTIVTLGNAALRVMRELVDHIVSNDPGTKLRIDHYGERCVVSLVDREIPWYPLAHPAAPTSYLDAHQRWTRS